MRQTLDFLSDTPDDGAMDVLSDVLDTVRLSSTVFVRTEMSPPWGIRSKPREHFAFHTRNRTASPERRGPVLAPAAPAGHVNDGGDQR